MEDKMHLMLIDAIARELSEAFLEFNKRCNGISNLSREEALALCLEQNDRQVEMLKKHRRHLLAANGVKVEPEVLYGEAVLLPAGGGGL